MKQCQFSGDSGKRKHDPQETVMERHEKKNKIKNEWICSVLHIFSVWIHLTELSGMLINNIKL